MLVEGVDVDLSDAVLAQVKLTQLSQFFKVLDFDDFVIGGMEDFQVFERAVLKSVQVLQLVGGDVEEFEVGHPVETPFKVAILHSRFHE